MIATPTPEAPVARRRHRPWPRRIVDADAGSVAATRRADVTCSALWGDRACVHMACSTRRRAIAVLSLACPDGAYPSVGARHAPAIRLERALLDLFGLEPEGAPDPRPWLDHGRWGVRQPLGAPSRAGPARPTPSCRPRARACIRSRSGPVHAGIIEPGHFRFTASGETVVRLEERLGYTHKGVEALMAGAPLERAAQLAGRASGDSTVAYAIAFARAVEAALGVDAPPRALWLRALMAELERLANHLGDIGAICNDAAFALHARPLRRVARARVARRRRLSSATG